MQNLKFLHFGRFYRRSKWFHAHSGISWSVVYNAVQEIRLAGSVLREWFLATNNLLSTHGQMSVTETLSILRTIFISMVCIQNMRLFGVNNVYVDRFSSNSTLSRWSVSCLLVYGQGESIAQCQPRSFTWLVWRLWLWWFQFCLQWRWRGLSLWHPSVQPVLRAPFAHMA